MVKLYHSNSQETSTILVMVAAVEIQNIVNETIIDKMLENISKVHSLDPHRNRSQKSTNRVVTIVTIAHRSRIQAEKYIIMAMVCQLNEIHPIQIAITRVVTACSVQTFHHSLIPVRSWTNTMDHQELVITFIKNIKKKKFKKFISFLCSIFSNDTTSWSSKFGTSQSSGKSSSNAWCKFLFRIKFTFILQMIHNTFKWGEKKSFNFKSRKIFLLAFLFLLFIIFDSSN